MQWTKSCKATRSKISKVPKLGALMTRCTSATDGAFPRNHLSTQPPASSVQLLLVPKGPSSTQEYLKKSLKNYHYLIKVNF